MGENTLQKHRDLNLDLIRGVATFLVLSVHFFLWNGFYYQPMVGKRMLLMCVMRMGFMTCVPLFLILTGYLCRNKELSRRYYLGLARILVTYLLCCFVCLALRWYRGAMTFRQALDAFMAYTAAPYGWYIEMYFGLFLLIPFLNLIWKGLESKKSRQVLLVTLVVLTALPSVVNVKWAIMPDWWVGTYPLLYYFLGAYLGEYQPKPSWWRTLVALAAVTTLAGAAIYLRGRFSSTGLFVWDDLANWNSLFVVCGSCLLFLLLRQIPVEKAPKWLRWMVGKAAQLSLEIYLLSWCVDSIVYPMLQRRVPDVLDRVFWYPVAVPVIFLGTALLAQLVEWVRKALSGKLGSGR